MEGPRRGGREVAEVEEVPKEMISIETLFFFIFFPNYHPSLVFHSSLVSR